MKTRVTPISQTKTQALARVLASVTHGYTRVCMGTVPPERLSALAGKFDTLYGIADTKGQRVLNKRAGRASTLFATYAPPDEYRVENERLPWMLLATPGDGVELSAGWMLWIDPCGSTISCVGTMTPARCVGRGGGRQRRWPNCTLKWVLILPRGDTVPLPGRCNVSRTSRAFTVSGRSRQSFSRSR